MCAPLRIEASASMPLGSVDWAPLVVGRAERIAVDDLALVVGQRLGRLLVHVAVDRVALGAGQHGISGLQHHREAGFRLGHILRTEDIDRIEDPLVGNLGAGIDRAVLLAGEVVAVVGVLSPGVRVLVTGREDEQGRAEDADGPGIALPVEGRLEVVLRRDRFRRCRVVARIGEDLGVIGAVVGLAQINRVGVGGRVIDGSAQHDRGRRPGARVPDPCEGTRRRRSTEYSRHRRSRVCHRRSC